MNVFVGILESACLSVCLCVCVSICVQNTSSCQSAGRGIKSHLCDSSSLFLIKVVQTFGFVSKEIENIVRMRESVGFKKSLFFS